MSYLFGDLLKTKLMEWRLAALSYFSETIPNEVVLAIDVVLLVLLIMLSCAAFFHAITRAAEVTAETRKLCWTVVKYFWVIIVGMFWIVFAAVVTMIVAVMYDITAEQHPHAALVVQNATALVRYQANRLFFQ